MHDLANKTAVVTAAAQGIGRASAEAFARAGARVIATDVNEELLHELAVTPNISTRKLDVRDSAAVKAFAAETGPADVLFNCAGFVHNGTILDANESELDQAFDLNVKSMYRTVSASSPRDARKGRRLHHQHVVHLRQRQRRSEPFPVRYNQSGSYRADEGHCGGLCLARHPMQCDLPGYGRRPRFTAAFRPPAIMIRPGRLSLPASQSDV